MSDWVVGYRVCVYVLGCVYEALNSASNLTKPDCFGAFTSCKARGITKVFRHLLRLTCTHTHTYTLTRGGFLRGEKERR